MTDKHMIKTELRVDDEVMDMGMIPPKEFKTGSKGYYRQSRVTLPDGTAYMHTVQLVKVGSKKEGAE